MKTRFFRLFLGTALITGLSAALPAATIFQSATFGPEDFSETFASLPDNTRSFSPEPSATFDKFNPALGTLTSATFTYAFTFTIDNVGGTGEGWLTVAGGGAFIWDGSMLYGMGVSGGDTTPVALNSITVNASINGSLSADTEMALAPLIGTGTANFGFFPSLSVNGSKPEISGDFKLTSGTLTMTFNYEPSSVIPEPSSYAALAGTLVLSGALLRRRRRTT